MCLSIEYKRFRKIYNLFYEHREILRQGSFSLSNRGSYYLLFVYA